MKQSRLKQSFIRSGVVAFGLLFLAVLALDVELSFLHVVGEQKRAYVLLGSSVGTLVVRSKARGMVLSLVFVLGVIALAVALSCLTVLDSHERAYTPLGIGTVCLLDGTVGARSPTQSLPCRMSRADGYWARGLWRKCAFGEMILTEKQRVIR